MEKKGNIDRVDETACEREEEQKRRERFGRDRLFHLRRLLCGDQKEALDARCGVAHCEFFGRRLRLHFLPISVI